MSNKKLNLIYVSSNGRSGSTLLEMLIGNHSSCFTTGEFQMLPSELKENKQFCGCGVRVSECEFWSQIYRDNKKAIEKGTIGRFRNGTGNSGKVVRLNEIMTTIFSRFIDREKITIYGRDNFEVLNAVCNSKDFDGSTFLIDASKDPYRLKWLALSGYFNLYAIHIVKEPQAMVYSFAKGRKSFIKTIYYTVRMSLRWIVENLIIDQMIKCYIPQNRSLRLKYENLASDHNFEMKRVFKFLSLDPNDIPATTIFSENHAISGNAMRFKSKEITLDRGWQNNMSTLNKFIVFFLTVPFRYLYK